VQEFILVGVILILIAGAYWSLSLFPRQREFQKRQRYVRSLSVGDEVVTYGGIIGRMIDIEAEIGIAHIEIADGVVVRVITASIMRAYDPEEIAAAANRGQDGETVPQDAAESGES
jgi:preprotein translocase subunit YajC